MANGIASLAPQQPPMMGAPMAETEVPMSQVSPDAEAEAALQEVMARGGVTKDAADASILEALKAEDPETLQEILDELSGESISEEEKQMLLAFIMEMLRAPEQYDALLQQAMQMGLPDDLFPEAYDVEHLSALRFLVSQTPAGMQEESMMPPVQNFRDGGPVSMKPVAQFLANQGRNGDTILAHITPGEARLLRARGGSGTINPVTGLPEFFLKKAFKKISKAVKKFIKSDIGKVVTVAAAVFLALPTGGASLGGLFGGAGAAGASGAIGGAAGGGGFLSTVGSALAAPFKAVGSLISGGGATAGAHYLTGAGPFTGAAGGGGLLGTIGSGLAKIATSPAGLSTLITTGAQVARGKDFGDALKDGLKAGLVVGGVSGLMGGNLSSAFGMGNPIQGPYADYSATGVGRRSLGNIWNTITSPFSVGRDAAGKSTGVNIFGIPAKEALGVGSAVLGGYQAYKSAQEKKKAQMPPGVPNPANPPPTGSELLEKDPEKYGVTIGGVNTITAPGTGTTGGGTTGGGTTDGGATGGGTTAPGLPGGGTTAPGIPSWVVPPPPGAIVTQALEELTNPVTGEKFMAPTGGYSINPSVIGQAGPGTAIPGGSFGSVAPGTGGSAPAFEIPSFSIPESTFSGYDAFPFLNPNAQLPPPQNAELPNYFAPAQFTAPTLEEIMARYAPSGGGAEEESQGIAGFANGGSVSKPFYTNAAGRQISKAEWEKNQARMKADNDAQRQRDRAFLAQQSAAQKAADQRKFEKETLPQLRQQSEAKRAAEQSAQQFAERQRVAAINARDAGQQVIAQRVREEQAAAAKQAAAQAAEKQRQQAAAQAAEQQRLVVQQAAAKRAAEQAAAARAARQVQAPPAPVAPQPPAGGIATLPEAQPAPAPAPLPMPVEAQPAPAPAPMPVEAQPAPVPAPMPIEAQPAPAPAPMPVEAAPAVMPVAEVQPQPPAGGIATLPEAQPAPAPMPVAQPAVMPPELQMPVARPAVEPYDQIPQIPISQVPAAPQVPVAPMPFFPGYQNPFGQFQDQMFRDPNQMFGAGSVFAGAPVNPFGATTTQMPAFFNQGGIAAVAPTRFNKGSLPTRYPRKVGAINGPGTATSDSIPAMLSDGEFVLTAKAVRGAGNGSRREGAKKMYQMMKALERKAHV